MGQGDVDAGERARAPRHRTGWAATSLGDNAARVVGWTALVASVLYFVSDVIEALNDGFSSGQLWLTLVAEAAVPIFVIGLAVAQHPRFGLIGDVSAFAYAYAFVFFAGTVVYALVNDTPDYETLTDDLGAAMLVHGVVMVVAGTGFGYAVIRARVFPAWTGVSLIAGVLFVAVTQDAATIVQVFAAGVRDIAFAGMGVALIRRGTPSPPD